MAEHQSKNQDHQKAFNPPGVQEPYNHDAHMQKEIKDALLKGTESAGIDIKVMAEDGVVRLYGVVDVLSHRTVAEEIVRKIPGVRHIDNDITVANEETFSDKQVYEAAVHALSTREEFRDMGCRVHKGVVTLIGHAGSKDDVKNAVRMVEGMAGVREVMVEKIKIGEGQKEDEADISRTAVRMLTEMGYDSAQFQVYCDAGTLFVKGFVPNRADRTRIKTAMHRVPGVARLETLLITDDQVGGEIH